MSVFVLYRALPHLGSGWWRMNRHGQDSETRSGWTNPLLMAEVSLNLHLITMPRSVLRNSPQVEKEQLTGLDKSGRSGTGSMTTRVGFGEPGELPSGPSIDFAGQVGVPNLQPPLRTQMEVGFMHLRKPEPHQGRLYAGPFHPRLEMRFRCRWRSYAFTLLSTSLLFSLSNDVKRSCMDT